MFGRNLLCGNLKIVHPDATLFVLLDVLIVRKIDLGIVGDKEPDRVSAGGGYALSMPGEENDHAVWRVNTIAVRKLQDLIVRTVTFSFGNPNRDSRTFATASASLVAYRRVGIWGLSK